MPLVIIYGPQGTGKNLHAEALKKHFGCQRIVEWDDVKQGPALRDGDLALTNLEPPFTVPGAKAYHIVSALLVLSRQGK